MCVKTIRVLLAAACALWLAGCGTQGKISNLFNAGTPEAKGDPETTGSISFPKVTHESKAGLLGKDPNDNLSLGKKHFRGANYGLAELHFRKAVELHPQDAEAWLGLAASYDRLRRFDLADRAYEQAIAIVGETAEILNNRGFSYMLRGDYRKARAKFVAAAAKQPNNPYIKNNLELLEESYRKGKAVR